MILPLAELFPDLSVQEPRNKCERHNPKTNRPYGHKLEFYFRYLPNSPNGYFRCRRCAKVINAPVKKKPHGDKRNFRRSDPRGKQSA